MGVDAVLAKVEVLLGHTYRKPHDYGDTVFNLVRIWTCLDDVRLYILTDLDNRYDIESFESTLGPRASEHFKKVENIYEAVTTIANVHELINIRFRYDDWISVKVADGILCPCKKLVEVNKYLRYIIEESKQNPDNYANSCFGVESLWRIIDHIILTVYGQDSIDFSMPYYQLTVPTGEFDDSEDKELRTLGIEIPNLPTDVFIGSMGFEGYIKYRFPDLKGAAFHNKMVELRNKFEIWQKEKLLKHDPALTIYF